jgi:hypothetical protein
MLLFSAAALRFFIMSLLLGVLIAATLTGIWGRLRWHG